MAGEIQDRLVVLNALAQRVGARRDSLARGSAVSSELSGIGHLLGVMYSVVEAKPCCGSWRDSRWDIVGRLAEPM
jgi:hypothetical protein